MLGWGSRLPCNPLRTKKGTLVIPRLLLGLALNPKPQALNPKPETLKHFRRVQVMTFLSMFDLPVRSLGESVPGVWHLGGVSEILGFGALYFNTCF